MSKFNKVKFSILVVFIVLLFANVQASELDTISGDGSRENPYVIKISNSNRMLKFACKELPFYFIIHEGNEGSYEINYDATTNEISFLQIQSANNINPSTPQNEISVALDKELYDNKKKWQVGVDTILSSGVGMSIPTYDIFEELGYLSSYSELNMSPPSLFGDFVSFETNNSTVLWVDKSTKLYNIVIKNYVIASKPNQYFFTSSKKNSEAGALFETMGFERDVTSGNGSFEKYIYPETVEPIIYIPVTDVYDDEKFNIVYKFGGYANTALNDTGENATNGLESLLTRNLIRIGDDFLLKMIRNELGGNLSIDSLIFNKFEPTKVDLYNTRATGINKTLRDVINNWFGILLRITYVVYIIILVYIGIVAIMNAGTEKQNKFFTNFSNWIVGLVILTFVPTYGIPFLFDINEALVRYISKDSSTMKTYYNEYDINETDDILGSDSATITIEELTALRAQVQQRYDNLSNQSTTYMDLLKKRIRTEIKRKSGSEATAKEVVLIDSLIDDLYKNYKYAIDLSQQTGNVYSGKSNSEILNILKGNLQKSIHSNFISGLFSKGTRDAFRETVDNNGIWAIIQIRFDTLYNEEHALEVIDETINIRQSDIMGTMRAYAGKYQKLIFAFIWYMLLFQLIGLTFLYYKRIFVIAILIAVFPIIMLFYCIDKMADGSSQTLSLWFKELLANIFIQTVHAVIYMVLVEMGLTIYKNDPGNWIFLVAAMLMILPAESIMKELFNLNGSTLRAVGGMLGKTALAIGTLKAFATAGKGSNDASVKEKNEKRFDKMQRRQDRADTRANIRATKRAGNMKNYDADGKLKDLKGAAKLREGAYHLATDARKAHAKIAPDIDAALRNARNVAAVTAGAMYGISGGDLESMAQGAMTAKALSGKTKNIDEFKLKTDLKSAYERKKKN